MSLFTCPPPTSLVVYNHSVPLNSPLSPIVSVCLSFFPAVPIETERPRSQRTNPDCASQGREILYKRIVRWIGNVNKGGGDQGGISNLSSVPSWTVWDTILMEDELLAAVHLLINETYRPSLSAWLFKCANKRRSINPRILLAGLVHLRAHLMTDVVVS